MLKRKIRILQDDVNNLQQATCIPIIKIIILNFQYSNF